MSDTKKLPIKGLPTELKKELRKKLSLIRLAKTGFFKRIPIAHPGIETELLLHRAVLDRALIDSFSAHKDTKKEVEDWLNLSNPDFVEACDRALLSPKGVYTTFKLFKQILRGNNARFRKFGQRHNKKTS